MLLAKLETDGPLKTMQEASVTWFEKNLVVRKIGRFWLIAKIIFL
jgi:hypothetical protein